MADPLAEAIARGWAPACACWSRLLLLSEPTVEPAQDSVAQIDLATRRISLGGDKILELGLVGCVEALLAHEIGHHVKYPGSLQVHARMRLLERSLLPLGDYSLINLFTDLMINERLGKAYRREFVEVYQAFSGMPAFHDGRWRQDPVFLFYLSLYEALWRLPPGTVMGPAETAFAERLPGYRADAALLVANLFALHPNVYTQFLYFLSVALRYLQPVDDLPAPGSSNPNRCGGGEPSPGDWADALTPTAREREAIERAIREGWFSRDQSERLRDMNDVEARIASLPSMDASDLRRVPEIMAAYYRQQAEAYLFRPPAQPRLGEPVVPTTLEEWEPDEGVRAIDWLSTLVLRGGDLGAAAPLMRTRIAEQEGVEAPLWQPRVEIFLDVSGSMPDPCAAVNVMTLAAQILVLGTVRAGGAVRAVLYSHAPVPYREWCRSELEMSRFLMHYVGGGTEFPFELLHASIRECRDQQPIRVWITDRDFDANFRSQPVAEALVREAAEVSPHCILLQHASVPEIACTYRALGVQVIPVADLGDFPKVARDLAWSLFPEGERGVV